MGISGTFLSWLAIAVLLQAGSVAAQDVTVSRLAGSADTKSIVSGALDDQFTRVPEGPVIFPRSGTPTWFRITSATALAAQSEPQVVLSSPYLAEVEAWTPGASAPVKRSIYGEHADHRYSVRAIVIGLPRGLKPGEPIYLRVETPATVPMPVSIESRDTVHRADLEYTAFRSMVLTTLVVIGALALGFWAGVGERSFLYFSAAVLAQIMYLGCLGGEFRDVPLLSHLATDPRASRVAAALGVIFTNTFHRSYLEMKARQPFMDRLLLGWSIGMGVIALVMLVTRSPWPVLIGNVLLLISTLTLLSSAVRAAFARQRDAYFLLLSWTPIIFATFIRALEIMGVVTGPHWLARLFPASFAFAGLLLIVGLAQHMLRLRRDRDRATQLAAQDALTGCYSRRGIEECLHLEVQRAHAATRPLSIAFVDLDRFKQINDTHGHSVGDQCLRIMCQRVRSRTRHRDLLGRYGGDELLVLMPDTPLATAMALANAVRENVAARPMAVGRLSIDCSLSIGVAELRPGESAQDLIERADAALYASKNA
ncbi:MAG TPA: diguanylate cyclase, partial [Steroidobacteraceae bacterium]|nr:diguanylate cyclase [Steroidobacteraceae bacterium]